MKNKGNGFTMESLRNSAAAKLNPHLFPELSPVPEMEITEPVKKKSKYGNKKTMNQGILFDSVRESNRWTDLQRLLKAGEIGFLERQIPYELNPGGTFSFKYILDFKYVDAKTGETIHEDCKGMRTKVYLKKKRLMERVHGIKITES